MAWKLFAGVETYSPAPEGCGPKQYESKDDALEAARTMMRQPGLHMNILYIEGPKGERIESEAIWAWYDARSRR